MVRKFIACDNNTVAGDGEVEIHLTPKGSADELIIIINKSSAYLIPDMVKIVETLPYAPPSHMIYNARMVMLLERIKTIWNRPIPPPWNVLVATLNNIGFFSFAGNPWTRPNLIQKFASLGFDRGSIVDPAADHGQEAVKRMAASGDFEAVYIGQLPEVMQKAYTNNLYAGAVQLPEEPDDKPMADMSTNLEPPRPVFVKPLYDPDDDGGLDV